MLLAWLRTTGAVCLLLWSFGAQGEGIQGHEGLRDAFAGLTEGGILELAPEVFSGNRSCGLNLTTSNVILRGPDPQTPAIIDCQGSDRALWIQGNNVTLQNLRFLNGTSDIGGCIRAEGQHLNLSAISFMGCHSTNAGGAIHSLGPFDARDLDFENCSSGFGGAIAAMSRIEVSESLWDEELNRTNHSDPLNSTNHSDPLHRTHDRAPLGAELLRLRGLAAKGCQATNGSGGVLWVESLDVELKGDQQLERCSATHRGGALYVAKASVTLGEGVKFKENSAVEGGAVYVANCSSVVTDEVMFEYNNASLNGGALGASHGTMDLEGCLNLKPEFQYNQAKASKNSPKIPKFYA